MAERTRVAIERRRVEQELKAADRLRFALADLSDRMRSLADVDAMQVAAAEVIGLALRVDRVGYGQVLEDDETFVVPNDWTDAGFPANQLVLGVASYGIYLWHYPVVVRIHDADLGVVGTLFCGFAAAIAMGLVSYHVIERPFLGARRTQQPQLPPASAGAAVIDHAAP